MLRRMLEGFLRGAVEGANAGRALNTGLRDLGDGGAFLRHGSNRDDAAQEFSRLRGDLLRERLQRDSLRR